MEAEAGVSTGMPALTTISSYLHLWAGGSPVARAPKQLPHPCTPSRSPCRSAHHELWPVVVKHLCRSACLGCPMPVAADKAGDGAQLRLSCWVVWSCMALTSQLLMERAPGKLCLACMRVAMDTPDTAVVAGRQK